MPEIGEKERNYLFKLHQLKSNDLMSSLRSQSPLEYPQMHRVLPSPSVQSRVLYLRKRNRRPWLRWPLVLSSNPYSAGWTASLSSRHHQLCHCHDLQLIQNHVAPSHGPPARVLSPLFFPARSLLLPKLLGKREHPKSRGPNLAWLPCLGLNPRANLPLHPYF